MTVKHSQKFGIALDVLKYGGRVRRGIWGPEGWFVYMPVPNTIQNLEFIQRMQSLPPLVKRAFADRPRPIHFRDELSIVSSDMVISGYSPSAADALAEDWEILD